VGQGVAPFRCIQSRVRYYAPVTCRYTNAYGQARAPFGRAAKAAVAAPQLAFSALNASV
jgi:hypothetical protein